jgi:predicted ATPase/signal transduction histidine kinase/tRNA A-37 threonylcarbamoyl transferase component Bud32
MITIPGYRIEEKIFESSNSLVFRAWKEDTDLPVVIKLLKGEYPKPERIVRFRREYETLKGIDIKGVIKVFDFESFKNSYAISMEDFKAESVKLILEKKKLTLSEFLKLTIKITEILNQLHQLNIIHKNINPSNILWNEESGELKLIDFGISAVLSHEIATIQNPNEFEGTLSYMSPEQTGRMNRTIDYRTDMYSLGITFYEMMTGRLPFESNDPMEMIYCHIAKTPQPPHLSASAYFSKDPKGLEILSKIILKLMSKGSEDRYLSFYGLKYDLEKCLKYLKKNQTLSGLDFHPGDNDFSDKFRIPQKLYGREPEIATLLDAFRRVCSRHQEGRMSSEMMMVTGYAGIGKSALVNEIHIPIVEKRGYFISGKFDRFKRNIPYSALTQAFQDLMRQILMESETQIMNWKSRILEAVSPNGQVINEVIPEVERIIGKQPPVPELPPRETQNRFNMYFQNFIRAFADESHPLTIFLDDLQWADLPTLKLIERLMLDSKTRYLFIIGAYRDNEVDLSHPLALSLDKLKNENAIVNFITLLPLEPKIVNQLISDSLKCSIADAEVLGKLCLAKTDGNPFFLIQFLNSLAEKDLIEFDNDTLKWEWDASLIEKADITSNVVDLMTARIQSLSESGKRLLKLASCIGNRFDLDTLAIINEKPLAETANEMNEALESGLIQPIGEGYRLAGYLDFLKDNKNSDKLGHEIQYKFLHDRVHQAANCLMGNEYKEVQLKIGRLLLQKLSKEEREETLFDIVNHLNAGVELISDQTEKNLLAEMNLHAGKKAKAATAYEIAFQYFFTGLNLLGEKAWEDNYSLTLEMNLETAEASYLTGNFEKTDKLAVEITNHARNLLDKIRINEIVIQSFMSRDRLKDSIGIAVEILKQLGVHIFPKPRKISVLLNIFYLRIILFPKKIEDLKNLPAMTDAHKLAAMRILMNVASSAYYTNILLSITIAFKMIHLSVRYGNSPYSSFAYELYGIILQSLVGKIIPGYEFGEFSIEIMNKFDAREYNARINFIFNVFIRHWKDKLSDTIEPFRESFQRGMETGDYEFGCLCSAYAGIHSFHSGIKLEISEDEMKKSVEIATKLKQEVIIIVLRSNRQVALNLMGKSQHRTLLVGESFNETEMTPYLIEKNNMADQGTLCSLKALLCVFFDEGKDSISIALESEKYKETTIGLVYRIFIYFYTSLIYLSNLPEASLRKSLLYLRRVSLNQKQLEKWARYAPENLLHKWHLVEAERCRIDGNWLQAVEHYDKAMQLARQNGYTHEEALANELAAKFYLSRKQNRIARAYMKDACYLYTIWGAKAKADHLNETYPELLLPEASIHGNKTEFALSDLAGTHPEKLDLATVQKASQTISGEIHLDKLLEKLLNIVVTNAGAQRGLFLLKDEEGFFVEGEAGTEKEEILVLQRIPYTERNDIPHVIINYVLRVNKMIVLDNALEDSNFKTDEYVRRNKLRSVLCLPLMFKNKLSGILYLENNLAPGIFTSERVEVLKILSGQIVISIENARLYRSLEEYNRTLEEKVERRTAEISQKNAQLSIQKEELRMTLENLKHSQFQLLQSEKMASLGQLVAGIAHEINNPVNFISAGVESLNDNLEEISQVMDNYDKITPLNVEAKLEEIKELKEKIEYKEAKKEIDKLIKSIKNGTKRTTEIVKGLRTFSRLDEDTLNMADIHEGLDSTLILLHNKYKNRIDIVKNYGEIPLIECYPGQLNQVFMNILANAVDSIDDKGTITISTSIKAGIVHISIKDTGRGIPENLKEKIFEPFYTTKEVGKGTGLGLSISHGIIEKHKGTIDFISEPGKGSEFIVSLPMVPGNKN